MDWLDEDNSSIEDKEYSNHMKRDTKKIKNRMNLRNKSKQK